MLFCQKPKKSDAVCTPVKTAVVLLAAAGAAYIVTMMRKKGKTAKHALGRAGCRCKDAMTDAAAEIFGDGASEADE